jgi:glycosyltransferase involved in cell wall biosynthesis
VTSIEVDGAPRLDAHLAEFRGLVETAQNHLARGRPESAAVYAQVAGTYAWLNPVGLFASPELESILGQLAGQLAPVRNPRPRTSSPREVLHIATTVYQTGGSTQAIACWIEQDQGRHHRVCVTRQGSATVPDKILTRLAARGDLRRLDTERGGLLQRAAALRAAATEADVVLLHSHPNDVVPVIAFAGVSGLPPVVYVNHADHVFWLGTSVTSALLNMRDSGRLLAAARRGIDPARSAVMARPLRPIRRTLPRDEAKRRLGVRPDQVLVVTAADAPKYRPVGSPSLLDLVVPVFERHADALLLAAGPAPEGPWAAAAQRTDRRVQALGRLPDVAPLHQAADVYLDSFPFASLTSLLEAGSFGTPVMTYRGHPEECLVLGADTRGLDEHLLCPSDPDEFRRELSRLITDAEWRRDLGERTQRAIVDTHTGEGWQASVARLYDFAARLDLPPSVGTAGRGAGQLDVLVDLVMAQTGYSQGVSGAIRDNLGLLRMGDRILTWRRLAAPGETPSLRLLLPEWVVVRAARWKRLLRQGVSR